MVREVDLFSGQSNLLELCKRRVRKHLLIHKGIQRGARPPFPPRFFSKSCSFQAILRENFGQNLGSGPPPPGVKTLLPPPGQNPGSAAAIWIHKTSNLVIGWFVEDILELVLFLRVSSELDCRSSTLEVSHLSQCLPKCNWCINATDFMPGGNPLCDHGNASRSSSQLSSE